DIRVVDLFADDADLAGQRVDEQLLIGKRFPLGVRLIVQPRIQRLQRVVERGERDLQLLGLLLQHADVRDDLQMLAVGGLCRRAERDDAGCGGQQGRTVVSTYQLSHVARLLASNDSHVQTINSKLSILTRAATGRNR